VQETNGCMVWGGAVNLSPVDDKIIRAEHPLSLDPEGQVLASVLSKKKSAGATHTVIDIPYGEGSKVEDLPDARDLAATFKRVGDHMDIDIACTITQGSEPIGRGIGPVLEARDVLKVLQGDGPDDLKLKSVRLADILFDLCGIDADARDILGSGEALAKFREIIEAQDGDPDVTVDDLQPGEHTYEVTADRNGIVSHIGNKPLSEIARRAGAPSDKAAGIDLEKRVGDTVAEGDALYRIHAENGAKRDEARAVAADTEAVRVRSREESLVEEV
ncbi:MAG: AMP phosphorylase, partial [Candidatus Nanohaloarchaea archaeon]